MNTKTKRKSAALRFANQVRKVFGKKPLRKLPLGTPRDETECSLALAIEDSQVRITKEGISFSENPVKVFVLCQALDYPTDLDNPYIGMEFPNADISKFVRDYDDCKYPELVDIESLLDR